MKIGIISDTHIKKRIGTINKIIDNYLNNVDMIIHVGDFSSLNVINAIKKKKRFVGVFGNNDGKSIRSILNKKEIINLSGYKIGLCHGCGDKEHNHKDKKTTIERAYNEFKGHKVDIVIFGHSHQPIIKTKKGILLLNPGSLTRKLKERWYSYMLLELSKKNIDVQVKFLCKK